MTESRFVVMHVRSSGGIKRRRRLLSDINTYVREERLGRLIPIIRFEPKARGEYYIGVETKLPGLRDANGIIKPPEQVMAILERARLSRGSYIGFCEEEEVKKFMSGTVDFESFSEKIVFEEEDHQAVEKEVSQVMNLIRSEQLDGKEHESSNEPDNQDAFDQLLWLCSAMGSGTFTKFRNVCKLLGLEQLAGGSYKILRDLSLLGHLESVRHSNGTWPWCMAPPAYVSSSTGATRFLAGQRVRKTEEKLAESVSLERAGQYRGPTNLRFETDVGQSFDLGVSRQVADAGCVSLRLAEALPSVDVFAQNLREDLNVSPTSYQFKRFDGKDYVATTPGDLEWGFYEVRHSEGEQYSSGFRFRDPDGVWRDGGIYDLIFVSLGSRGTKPHAEYDMKQSRLIMRREHRWPTIYEKALVLAEGFLPKVKWDKQVPFLIYQGIPEKLATILCKKLNVELVRLD